MTRKYLYPRQRQIEVVSALYVGGLGVDSAGAGVDSTGAADWRTGALNQTAPGGFGFDGLMSDVLIFGSDVLGNATQKALLLQYFNTVYGL